jgi:endo-1,4-beta-xylanase
MLVNKAEDYFHIGVGVNALRLDNPDESKLIKAQFSTLTPENCMKMQFLQPEEGCFDFKASDRFVNYAISNDLEVIGHCLLWVNDDSAHPPAWFFADGDKEVSAEQLLLRLKTYIDTVVGRYKGSICAWDVVNEALSDKEGEFLRSSKWLEIAGDEVIVKAFQYAHEADPDALLIYNDYNNEMPRKREKMIRFVKMLKERGAPIQAIGIQGHFILDEIPFEEIELTLNAMRELGVKVVVSELDLDVIPRGIWWADGGANREEIKSINPYVDGLPADVAERQAQQYAQLFKLFKKHADVIERVSFWNLHDGYSWLNTFPWKRVNYPLLFDRNGNPKAAYRAVREIF